MFVGVICVVCFCKVFIFNLVSNVVVYLGKVWLMEFVLICSKWEIVLGFEEFVFVVKNVNVGVIEWFKVFLILFVDVVL